ncbi:TonB-dependent receptor [Sphingomonas sp. dw_22]|uniref:TonB-dependent receptor n=1 Tax=Sphingomonas sp. dw_22 TaxID=2721175 RepID=UPI001BD4CFB6|nr:TonB-dependent receptor [Sphingomonas sp. dw_22]
MKHRYLVGAAFLCCVPFTAFAQETVNAPESEDAIVVTGQRAQQERSIEIKRDAIGVLDVAASDEIGQLPDRNVAEVVEHLPGVGVSYDQGEGRYVSVRGVPSALNGYTLDGLEIGNPDGNTRALPLDVVSGQLLNRVEIAKVKTADMDGQGIGGTLNLVTQTAFDYKDAFNVSVNAQAGYQELNEKVPVRGDASVAGRFGPDEQFGVVLGVSYSNRDFVSEGFYPDDWRPVAGFARGGAPTNIKYTEYGLDRKRIGATGAFDWHPNDHQTFYVRGLYSKFIENEIRARYRLDFATQALVGDTAEDPSVNNTTNFHLNPDGLTGTVDTGTERREDLRLDYKVKTVLTGIVGGSTELDRLKLEYMGARSHNEVLDRFPTWQFRCNPGTVDFDFSHTIYSATPRTECTPNDMQFRSYLFHHESGTEGIWQGRFDATYDLGGESFLKAGVKYRTSDRDFDSSEDTWGRGGNAATRFTMGQFGLDGPAVIVRPDNDDPGREFVNGPTFNIQALKDFTAKNIGGAFFVKDDPTSIANATLNDFNLTEDVGAAYVMAKLKFGVVTVTPGVRFEHTRLHITGNQLQDGTTILPATRSSDYDDFLPSLIFRVDPSPDMVLRLAYSRSIGRPEYANLSPGGEITVDDGTQPGLKAVSVSFGNPDLKPFRADNFDATAEWYFAKGGLLSFGAFAKFIKNPIFTQSYTLFDTSFNGQPYETASFSQPLNADKGKILGLEAQYQQQFDFLPGLLSGFGIALNATLTESNLDIPDGPKGTFPGQSDYLYGAKLFYQKGRVEASIAYHNTGKQLISAGLLDSGVQDQYNNDLRRLDAKASFKLLPGTQLFFEAQNLTDEPTRQYQSGNTDWIIQNERYGRTFYAGISAKF